MKKFISLVIITLLAASCSTPEKASNVRQLASETAVSPTLTVKIGGQVKTYTREDLLRLARPEKLVVENDPVYSGRRLEYTVVPAADLFKGAKIAEGETLLFSCIDGFSAPISAERLLNTDPQQSIAYLAIETQDAPWAPLKPGSHHTAGPYYIVWGNPEKSKIMREEWPFQLAGFELKPPLAVQFPNIVPVNVDKNAAEVRRGFEVFSKNCLACHTLNGEGPAQMGPDLNIPFNPTEYLKADFLVKQIRDPQSIKRWSQSKMTGFGPDVLSDTDLHAVVRYLKHMAGQKHLP